MACLVEEDLAAGDGDVEEEVEVRHGAVPPRPLAPRRGRCRRRPLHGRRVGVAAAPPPLLAVAGGRVGGRNTRGVRAS